MAGNQTEVIDEEGSDCGTEATLDFVLEESDVKDFQRRYIKVGSNRILLTKQNADKYIGKEIHMYSPMFCTGNKLCEKCAGKQTSKFVGLDSNKIATTLTNLNMKKFHDSTLRFTQIDPEEILINKSVKGAFSTDNTDISVEEKYLEVYVPDFYFENSVMAELLGDKLNLFGICPVGIFKNGEFDHFDSLNLPSWNKFYIYETEKRKVKLPGTGMTPCTVLKYLKGHKFCISSLLEDASNAQLMLRFVTYGKIPGTVPYNRSLELWRKNQKLNSVNFGVASVIQEVVLSCAYRWKKDPNLKFAKIIGKNPSMSQYDYEMASIRRICQVTSTYTGITFESFDDMVTTGVNRAREHGNETESPLEALFKL